MSSYTRARSRRQQRHSASRSQSHAQDKHQGDIRRQTDWMPVPTAQTPSPKRDFGKLDGHEFKLVHGKWSNCEQGEAYADYLESEAHERSWYNDSTSRRGVPVKMKRPVETPIEILTVSFAPWESDWTQAQLKAGNDPRPKLVAVRNQMLAAVQKLLSGQRYLLGFALHCDTDDLHFDFACSRQDGVGGRIGTPGLRLVGPWMVGIDRQLRVGAQIAPRKQKQFTQSVRNFQHRYGEETRPLDVILARALDKAADNVIGEELNAYKKRYAASVPELERKHAEARLQQLDAARAKIAQEISRPEPFDDMYPTP